MELLRKYIKSRFDRGFSLNTLGPNEARFIYDLVSGYAGLGLALLFDLIYIHSEWEWWLIFLPPAFLLANGVLGIYSYAKLLSGPRKSGLILLSMVVICAAGAVLSGAPSMIFLWAALTAGPVIIPRILLAISYGRHKTLFKKAVNQKGPILVVGGAGYIGTHVVELLLQEGRTVRVLDRLMYEKKTLTDFIDHPGFELIEGDATDIAKLTQAMQDVSAVVHLAGLVGDPACAVNPEFTRHTNIITTRMIKEVAQAMGVHRFVFASSCSVYGASDTEVREGDTLNPVSLYAQTKIDSERELLYSVRDDFYVTILRFATVFGHSRRPRFDLVANLLTAQGMTDGLIRVIGPNQWRPLIHVHDLARAIVMVLKADPTVMQGQIFNVGDKRLNMTIQQLGECVRDVVALEREVKLTIEENAQDKRNYAVSFEKIRSTLGFEAEIMVREGISEIVKLFKEGAYRNYKTPIYSNLEMTKESLSYFQDPQQSWRLYAPLSDPALKGDRGSEKSG